MPEPWLAEHAGCSVTEIEALAGALRNPTPDAAFFYLRAPGDRQLDARLKRYTTPHSRNTLGIGSGTRSALMRLSRRSEPK
jgi:hypothetical protein